MISTAVV